MKYCAIALAVLGIAPSCASAETVTASQISPAIPHNASPPMPPVAAPSPETAPVETAKPCCFIPAGAPVIVELVGDLSSKTQKAGDTFTIRLAEPLLVGGTSIMPAGALGVGEVIDAAPPGMGGRAGKLVLAAHYVESGGVRLPLRAFKLSAAGKDYTTAAMITTELVGIVGMAVHGGNVDYPSGTRASAKVAADMTVAPIEGVSALPAPATSDPVSPSSAPSSSSPTLKGPSS